MCSEKSEYTNQSTEQVHSLQDQLLVSDPGHPQLLQVLVRDLQQLLSVDLLPLKVMDVLLETVVQSWKKKENGSRKKND